MVPGVLLGLWAFAGGLGAERSDSVYGVVRDAVSGSALAGVAVETESRVRTRTDERGAYAISSSGRGSRSLRFTRPGFEPFAVDVTLPTGRSLRVDVGMNPLPVTLPTISVATMPRGSRPDSGQAVEIGLRRYTPDALRADPLISTDDPLLAAATDVSVEAQPGAGRALRVHGGSADQNLVLLDGLPLYGLAHLGGSAGVLDPDLVGRVDRHTDVPPAAYGGRLSSVIDVGLRPPDPDGLRVSGAWSTFALRQSVSTPLGSGGALQAALRRSYRGLFPGDVEEGEQNGFGDALVHLSLWGRRDRLSAYLVDGSDNLAFAASMGPGSTETRGANGFDWSHRTAGIVWRHDTGPRRTLTVRAWVARAHATLAWAGDTAVEQVTSEVREPGVSMQLSPTGPEAAAATFGVSLSRPSTVYLLARTPARADTAAAGPSMLRLASAPLLASVFGQGEWRVGGLAELTAGLRATTDGTGRLLLEPRLSTRFDLGRRLSVLVGYGRTHQFVQSLRNEESPLDQAIGAELPLAVGSGGVMPARADLLSGEVTVRPDPRSRARVYGYVRSLRDVLAVPVATGGPFARGEVASARGGAHGFEAEFARSGGRLDLHAAVGAESAHRDVEGVSYVPGVLRSRWLLAGMGYHLDGCTVARLSGTVAAGAPTTPVTSDASWDGPGVFAVGQEIVGSPEVVSGLLNRDRLPTYWRLDAGLVRDWRIQAIGRVGTLTSSVTIFNLLGVRNPLAYTAALDGPRRSLDFPSRAIDLQLGWHF